MTTPAYENAVINLTNAAFEGDKSRLLDRLYVLKVAARVITGLDKEEDVSNKGFAAATLTMLKPFIIFNPNTRLWTNVTGLSAQIIEKKYGPVVDQYYNAATGAEALAKTLESVARASIVMQEQGTLKPGQTVAHEALKYVYPES